MSPPVVAASTNPKAFVYVCLVCSEAFAKVSDHDFDLCKVQYEMALKWRREMGEVIHAN